MDVYLRLLIEGTVLIGCILFLLWIFLMKSGKSPRLNMRDASLSSEELEGHAKKIAIEHAVSVKKRAIKSPSVRMNDNYKFILNVYQDLSADLQKKMAVPPASEWLLDNFYIIEKQVKGMRRDLKKSDYNRLPILKSGPLKGQIRIFAVAVELVAHTDGQIDEKILTDYLKAYQSHAVLFDREIVALPMMLTLALIENIRELCEEIKKTQSQWHKADKIFTKWLENDGDEPKKTIKLFEDSLKSQDEANPAFVEHLFYRLRRSGRSYAEVLRIMDENLNKLGATTEEITQKEHGAQSVNTISMGNTITSLHFFSSLDWSELFETVSMVEQILKKDPDGTYPLMDIATRSHYRTKVEELALGFGVSEIYLAKEAILFAEEAFADRDQSQLENPAIQKTWHVGYYLIGKGLKSLENKEKKINSFRPKAESMGIKNPGILYLGSMGLITLLFLLAAVRYATITASSHLVLFSVLVIIAVLIPASEIAVDAVNWIVSHALKPAFFPRLQLREGIPKSMSTIVAVPTLLSDQKRVKELLAGLESHYLSNREDNLYFALVGAFSDADKSAMKDDPEIIKTALAGINALNLKYAPVGSDKFYFFHRDSQYNEKNDKWFGWERKRGALMEFNDLIMGATDTSFVYASAKKPPFDYVKYVITLDSDTILPMGMAKKMIATMAHPLNQPVIDKQRGVVVEGYGLMQPRIEVENESSNKSLFSRIFTGQEGIDPYATAISDVYQDLFGEGIFVGKGIYDLAVFQTIMKDAIPDNTILSHDLLEGSYVRTGLVTDLKLVDSYPSKYNSFSARLHRWVRGDWQLVPILFRKIFDRRHDKIFNPLSRLSKWKMFDNLRRSLVPPALMLLVFLSFSILPGSIFFWFGFFLLPQIFSLVMGIIGYLVSARFGNDRIKRYMPVMFGLKAVLMQFLLVLIFLPYQAWLMSHAIMVTLTRVFITRKNLLEWVTADDTEKFQKNSLISYVFTMKAALLQAPIPVILALFFKPEALLLSLFFFAIWVVSPVIAWFISRDHQQKVLTLSEPESSELGRITRKTWRYFEDFSNAKSHYLIPDNYQADPPRGIAQRTSPTNIGLGLLAPLTARDFGYIGTGQMMALIDKTVDTIEGLEKWQGHLLNWYDTLTLKPLRPAYISTVDSGNFLCYLVTLKQGLLDYLKSPLIDSRFLSGIRDTLHCVGKTDYAVDGKIPMRDNVETAVDLKKWHHTLETLIKADAMAELDEGVWKTKIVAMITLFNTEMTTFLPGIGLLNKMPERLMDMAAAKKEAASDAVFEDLKNFKIRLTDNADLIDLPKHHQQTVAMVNRLLEAVKKWDQDDYREELAWLEETKIALSAAATASQDFVDQYTNLLRRIDALVDAMEFLPLYDKKKELFSIGFNLEDNKLTNSFYDLLASEARQTSYICIAKGKIPASHWFKLGRALTNVDHYKGLISWTGTMFEYLMPLLIMKSYQNTLLDETYSFVIKSQMKYGDQREMPWGTSESGYHAMDKHHDYKYKAIGVPWLGLKRGLIDDAVTAPYATFLALMVNPEAAIKNIRRLKADGLEGPYGFYEAADYTPERLGFETKRALVKSFMAHHQGMSLMALNNCVNHNIMQTRFHNDPEIHAARLLLQEKVSSDLIFTKGTKEKLVPYKGKIAKEISAVRRFTKPNTILPKAHILSNGNYSVMITERGTGYSKSKMAAVTRWREDSTLDQYGTFFYLKNVESKAVWSAAYGPLNQKPDQYEVVFTADKATFKRTDGDIETKTEVVVASGDNVEIRRITLKNNGKKACTLELTSYFELVMATQAGDIAHPAFGNLFIKTEIEHHRKCLIATRRPRSDSDKSVWLANAIVTNSNLEGEIQYETDRMQFIGRGNNSQNPVVINQDRPLSSTSGPVLDPVMSTRIKVTIEAGKTASFSFVTAFCESKESILNLIDKYHTPSAIEGAFKLALTRSQVETRYLNLDTDESELYQDMISHLVFLSPTKMMNQEIILKNTQGQSALWKYGISGDNPIVVIDLSNIDQVKLLVEVLKAHEYWRLMGLNVDLVILSEEEYSYSLPLYALISDMVLSKQTHEMLKTSEDLFILEKNKIAATDIPLLYAVARVILKGGMGTLREQIECVYQSVAAKLIPEKIVASSKPINYSVSQTDEPERLYNNGIGGFKKDGSEYIIHLKNGENTPAPWVNVIANQSFGFMVSESGSGYAWYQNSRENKLTPWSNDVVSDPPGEVVYLGDGDTGEIWTITPLPIREAEDYTIKHGFGYTNVEHASHGIKQRMIQFVPTTDAVKISLINLKNESNQERHITLTYYIRPVLGVSDQATALHINTEQDNSGALLIRNPYNESFPGEVLLLDASIAKRSVTSDRKAFLGNGNMSRPEGLANISLDGVLGAGFDPCGAIQVKITLGPNERKDVAFLMGIGNNQSEVEVLSQKYRELRNVQEALNEVIGFWKSKLGIIKVETPIASINLMLDGWLQYQVISCRLWGRSGFYQAGGAFGFRDQLQDALSIANLWPEITRAQILLHASHQYVQGDVQHWWHEPLGLGTRTHFSDDRLWLPYVTAEYIRITGDHQILEEDVNFIEEPELGEFEDEKCGVPWKIKTTASLYEHCLRALEISLKFGEHGLPLMGSGDWNDGMNTVGNKGQGESVWLGWFLIANLDLFMPICKEKGDLELAQKYESVKEKMMAAIEKTAWDGSWYRRAYFDNGDVLGSAGNSECKIDSIAQSWSVISGAGEAGRSLTAMKSLDDYLVSREDGLIKLLTPPFDQSELEPGYIKGYIPGVRENGGQYTHAAAWAIIAFAKLGDGDKAWELFELINPINHTTNMRDYTRYKVEPYVVAADVYSTYPHTGRGGWTWYTGAAGWMYRAGLEYILGFQKNGETIVMDPCIPRTLKEYQICYRYQETNYHINVKNPDAVNKGVKIISVDGIVSTRNVINLVNDKINHEVDVLMGL
ncbi:GH36-type glycosyl hydrolase domain-containing protein [Acetobacterium sp. KB-1]|jgi:cellobiose phosphorylase|uniref:GH36-type glycosyl hydrolase domain-containing protein n=1 Tax=Acetobacterium sp. KB-1 TaxID=2184575 RepID=UPI000DBEBDD0|nr:glucoamylase family protein [Acetobacterium sp. KB-1]AWW26620.1 glycosyl transferase [Acetobacterium sp. KB-1]